MAEPTACADCGKVKKLLARCLCRRCYDVRRDAGTLRERPTGVQDTRTRRAAAVRERLTSSTDLATAAGVSERQLDYWVRSDYLHPVDPLPGNGYAREWTSDEAAVAMLMGRLVTAGIAPKIAHDVARAGGKLEIGPGVVVLVEAEPSA